ETVGAQAIDLPDQQAPTRLELYDIAGSVWEAPKPCDRFISEENGRRAASAVNRQAEVGPRPLAPDLGIVRVQDQVARRRSCFLGMAWHTTLLQNRFHIPEVFDVLDTFHKAYARLVLLIPSCLPTPLLTGLVALLGGQQWRLLREVPDRVTWLRCR